MLFRYNSSPKICNMERISKQISASRSSVHIAAQRSIACAIWHMPLLVADICKIFVNHIRLLLTVSVVYYWTLGMAQARFIYQGTSPHHVPDVPVSTNRKFSAKWIMDNFASITTNSIHGTVQIFYYRVCFLQEWSANLG